MNRTPCMLRKGHGKESVFLEVTKKRKTKFSCANTVIGLLMAIIIDFIIVMPEKHVKKGTKIIEKNKGKMERTETKSYY